MTNTTVMEYTTIECKDCVKKYVGQSGRSFETRFEEHKRNFDTCDTKSLYKYAKHLLKQKLAVNPIETSMTISERQQKSRKLNTLKQYRIYKLSKSGEQLNEQYTERHNLIFKSILKIFPETKEKCHIPSPNHTTTKPPTLL
jgi:hypothetical protein